jgi:branched-chain amino acid transport system substrate-binding protein
MNVKGGRLMRLWRHKGTVILGILLVLALCMTCLAGCGPQTAGTAGKDTLKIGVPLPLSGDKAAFGQIKKNGYLLAQEEINAAGGINGRQLEMVFQDTKGEPEVAASVAEEFITVKNIPFLVGEYSSAATFAVAGVAERYGIPYLADTGAADKITQQGWQNVFRLNPSSTYYAQGLNDFLKEVVKPQTMAILYEHTDFGSSTAEAMVKDAATMGVKIVLNEGYEAGAVDFKPLLTKVKDRNPDVVYMVSYVMDASLLMRQAKELRLSPKIFAGGAAGFALPEFITNASDASKYVVTSSLWSPRVNYPGAKEFAAKFQERFKEEPPYHGAEAYATTYVVADTLRRAKSLDPQDIREALAATDMMTVFGPVKFVAFDNYTNQNRLSTLVLQVINGVHETVWPKEFASANYVYPIPAWDKR